MVIIWDVLPIVYVVFTHKKFYKEQLDSKLKKASRYEPTPVTVANCIVDDDSKNGDFESVINNDDAAHMMIKSIDISHVANQSAAANYGNSSKRSSSQQIDLVSRSPV